jgi:hypothetical protein
MQYCPQSPSMIHLNTKKNQSIKSQIQLISSASTERA